MTPKKIRITPPHSVQTKWSRAIRYGDLIFTTAHSAYSEDDTIPDTLEAQIRACFENLKNTLEAGNSGLDLVLHCDCFLANNQDFKLMNRIFDEYFGSADVPTTRSVTEVKFTSSEYLFEIQAIAGVKD